MSLPKHVANYLKAFDYDKSDVILCEHCQKIANEIHHIEPRSSFGSKTKDLQDHPNNLAALCRPCHEIAHGERSRDFKAQLKYIIRDRKYFDGK